MTILNENLLPNPFKEPGAELSNVFDAIERELIECEAADDFALPAFLDAAFLARLEAEITAASAASATRKLQGRRIVDRLRSHLFGGA